MQTPIVGLMNARGNSSGDNAGYCGILQHTATGILMQVAAFLTCIRHVSRVIWAEHLALAEGFEEDVVDLLKQRSVPYRGGSPRVWICVISVCQNGTSLLQTIHNGKI